jgi:hypothetical protein
MSERYFARNAAGDYLRRDADTEWVSCRDAATAFTSLAEAEAARREGGDEPRTLWDADGRQVVARQIGGEWFATPVRISHR